MSEHTDRLLAEILAELRVQTAVARAQAADFDEKLRRRAAATRT